MEQISTQTILFTSQLRAKRGRLVLRLLCDFLVCLCIYIYIYLCVRTYHVHNNYVMNIVVAMQPFIDFGNLDGCFV